MSRKHTRTPENIVSEYIDLLEKRPQAINKKRKEVEKRIQQLLDEYKYIELDKQTMYKYNEKKKLLLQSQEKYKFIEKYIDHNVDIILHLLEKNGFIERKETIQLTFKGTMACCLKEVPCLVFAELLETNALFSLNTTQLISFLSCFTNINVQDDVKDYRPNTEDNHLNGLIERCGLLCIKHQKTESEYQIHTGTDYTMHYDLIGYVEKWTTSECKWVLQEIESKKGIFLGEFVKALLKITNIACELEKIAELTGNMDFLSKLREIPNLCLKYVVTNQSLYI